MENVIVIPAVDTDAATAPLSTCVKAMLDQAVKLALAEAEDRSSRAWAEWECKVEARHEEEMEEAVAAAVAGAIKRVADWLRREAASAGPAARASVLMDIARDIEAGRFS